MIVVDASAILEVLLQTSKALQISDRLLNSSERMHAPQLIDIEVTQVLRRLVLRKDIAVARAEQALADLSGLVIERHAHQPFILRIWDLRNAMTAYDGAYVALAEALDAPFLTCDKKLAGAAGHRAKIELVTM